MPLTKEQQEEVARANASAVGKASAKDAKERPPHLRGINTPPPPPPSPDDDTEAERAHLKFVAKGLADMRYDDAAIDRIVGSERKRLRAKRR